MGGRRFSQALRLRGALLERPSLVANGGARENFLQRAGSTQLVHLPHLHNFSTSPGDT